MSSQKNFKVYMDIKIGVSGAGRIIFQLFNDLTHKTSQNFRALCTGQFGKVNNQRLCYINTKIHKIVDGFVIQGGDITNSGGKGGYSIYGRTFVDQNFSRTHSCAGLLSMANSGRNTNSSQFYITLKACPHLDGKNVVFGQVIDGMQVVKKISKVPIDKQNKPRYPIIIVDCGQVDDFRGFLRYDPFKKQVFQQIRQARQKIIRDQHAIRKLLAEGLDPNQAYNYKKRLQTCQKNLAQLNRKQEELQYEKNNKQQEPQQKQQKFTLSNKESQQNTLTLNSLKQKFGQQKVNRLLQIRLKINEAQAANNQAALQEDIRQNDVNYHKMMKKKQWLVKQKQAQQQVLARGISKQKLYLNRSALKKEQQQKKNESFGWNVYGQQAYYKAYYKRCANLQKNQQQYQKQIKGIEQKPSQEALNKLQQQIIKQQQKRSLFSRRRVTDEDQTVNHINQRNRVYNKKLQRNFGVYASATSTALQLNNLK